MAKRACTQCGTLNETKATECEKCGVIFKDIRRGAGSEPLPFSCEYADGRGERCRYPPTMSTSTGGGGPWFCAVHARERHTDLADQLVIASREYKPERRVLAADELEAGARARAVYFGVDPDLPPHERYLAVRREANARKQTKRFRQAIDGPEHVHDFSVGRFIEREPGQDDEERNLPDGS